MPVVRVKEGVWEETGLGIEGAPSIETLALVSCAAVVGLSTPLLLGSFGKLKGG